MPLQYDPDILAPWEWDHWVKTFLPLLPPIFIESRGNLIVWQGGTLWGYPDDALIIQINLKDNRCYRRALEYGICKGHVQYRDLCAISKQVLASPAMKIEGCIKQLKQAAVAHSKAVLQNKKADCVCYPDLAYQGTQKKDVLKDVQKVVESYGRKFDAANSASLLKTLQQTIIIINSETQEMNAVFQKWEQRKAAFLGLPPPEGSGEIIGISELERLCQGSEND